MVRTLIDRLRASFGLLPTTILIGAVGLAVLAPELDQVIDIPGVTGDPDTARQIVAVGATATVTFAGLVFSITVLALQLTSGQFSPRVLRHFLRDLPSQLALGTFVGVFVYDLLAMARIENATAGEPAFVPHMTVNLSILASGVAVFSFVGFVSHIAESMRAVVIIESVAQETRTIAPRVPRLGPEETADSDRAAGDAALDHRTLAAVITRPGPGAVLQSVGYTQLAELAAREEAVIHVTVSPGDFVASGQQVCEVWTRPGVTSSPIDWDQLSDSFSFGIERTMVDDLAFGYRQLVDIAERALSPGVNDPTTAVQCIDRIHDLLRDELRAEPLRTTHRDDDGQVRVVHRVVRRPDLLDLAVREIRHYGSDSFQVVRRLRAMLDDLVTIAGPDDRPAILQQQRALARSVRGAFADDGDRASAGVGDPQGVGGVEPGDPDSTVQGRDVRRQRSRPPGRW